MPETLDFDVLIAGGGMVGASLACALDGAPLRVGLVEATPFDGPRQPSYDDRPLALSFGTRRILEALGVWEALQGHANPIRTVHVSERERFGAMHMHASDYHVEALGYVTEARALGQALGARMTDRENLTILCPARIEAVSPQRIHVDVRLQDPAGQALRTRLLVAADGGRSPLREMLGVGARQRNYEQTAVTANVTPERSHENVAYERFTASGPIALLPMRSNRCGLVWSLPNKDAEAVMALSDEAFLSTLGERFGRRLGRFLRIGKRGRYPLSLIRSRAQVGKRSAIIGNAAHTLHPVAGQGFNLGVRDAASLAEVLVDACRNGRADMGQADLLQRYAAARRHDQQLVTLFTDTLIKLFSNRLTPVAMARNLGLIGLENLPVFKRRLAHRAMGIEGHAMHLLRGLPLWNTRSR